MLSYDTILFHGSVIAVDGKHRLSFNIYVRIMTFKALKLMKGYGGISDYIITCNTKDFENSEIPAVNPIEFLKLLKTVEGY